MDNLQDNILALCEVIKNSYKTISLVTAESLKKFDNGSFDLMYSHFNIKELIPKVVNKHAELFSEIPKQKSQTQLSSGICEKFVVNALIDEGYTETDLRKNLDASMFKSIKAGILKSEKFVFDLKGNVKNMEDDRLYICHQPFGSQSPPDILLLQKIANSLYVFPIEVKQGDRNPTWNNNPPKANFGYIFCCRRDKAIYFSSGKTIRSTNIVLDDQVKHILSISCVALTHIFYDKSSKTNVVSYKKIEFSHFPTIVE